MRKIALFMVVSVDGFFEGLDHDISWHMVDDEFNQFAIKQMKQIDTLLLGHRTYQLFEDFWPSAHLDPTMSKADLLIAKMLDEIPKVTFSHHSLKTNWKNVQVVTKNVKQEVKKLKISASKDIAIFGSNNLCVNLMREGLVDEFRVMVCPVAIGEGTSLFSGLKQKQNLKLVSSRRFKNGNILLTYQK